MLGSLMMLASGVLRQLAQLGAGRPRPLRSPSSSGNCARMRAASEMSRVSTATPAVSAKACTIGSSECGGQERRFVGQGVEDLGHGGSGSRRKPSLSRLAAPAGKTGARIGPGSRGMRRGGRNNKTGSPARRICGIFEVGLATGGGRGRDFTVGSENDPAFQARQHLLPAALSGAGQWRSRRIRHRCRQTLAVLEYSHCQYHHGVAGHRHLDYPGGDARIGQSRRIGRVLWRWRHAAVQRQRGRYRGGMVFAAVRVPAHRIPAGLGAVLVR